MMQKKNWVSLLVLVVIAGIAYLPLISRLGYLNDDWYLMYDGHVGGADFFHEVYRIDRPLRGYLMQAAFFLFGMNPLYYHLSAFVFRVLSAIGLLWLCNQLWHKRENYNLLAALLFLVYPGFLSQVNPIDYQSQIFSLACGMFSAALTIKAIRSEKPVERVGYASLSIALAWIYLGLVEYFLGFEALRLMAVGVLFWRDYEKPVLARLKSALWAFAPFLLGAGGFLVWRLFLFEAERRATDVGVQFSTLFSFPLTGLWWLNYLIQDVFKVLIAAWAVPLNAFAFSLRLRDMFIGFALAIAAALVLLLALRRGGENDEGAGSGERSSETREQVWTAMVTIVAGLIPVIFVNRHVILPEYSRYALASSVGVVILLSVIFEKISVPSLRTAVISFFVAIAVLTHYGNAWQVAVETEATRNFWWQAAWRAPQIKEGVTLVVSYPGGSLSEDYFVWGPANLIYYPGKQDASPLKVKLPAAILTSDVVLGITTNGGMETPLRRGNYLERDFGNVLVVIQSTPNGCVRFINGDAPELSPADDYRLFLVAPHSKLDDVVTDGDSPVPPALVFGKEPERGWCYYYQKADLARQRREWDAIPILLKEALDKGYYPDSALEWMPFLQAYAVQGDLEKMRATLKLIASDRFLRLQTCEIMTDFTERETLTTEVQQFIQNKICE
jgi:hypothetical protein